MSNSEKPKETTPETLYAQKYLREIVIPAQQEEEEKLGKIIGEYALPRTADFDRSQYEWHLKREEAQYRLELKEIFAEAIASGEKSPEERKNILDSTKERATQYLEIVKATMYAVLRDQDIKQDVREEVLTPESFLKRMKICKALQNLPEDPKYRETFIAALRGEKLTDQQIDLLADFMKPEELKKGPQFYGVVAGVLLDLMPEESRLRLVKRVTEKNPKEANRLLETLVTTGNLTFPQAEQFAKSPLDGEKLNAQRENFGKAFHELTERVSRPEDKNMALQTITFPHMGGLFVSLWGYVTMLLNSVVNIKALGFKEGLAALAKNPYMYVGGAAAALGNLLRGNPLPGEKMVSEPSAEEKREMEKIDIGKRLRTVLTSQPMLTKYLKNGGFEILAKLRKKKEKDHEEYEKKYGKQELKKGEFPSWFVTYEELLAAEKNPDRQKILAEMEQDSLAITGHLNAVIDLGRKLDTPLHSQQQFNRQLSDFLKA